MTLAEMSSDHFIAVFSEMLTAHMLAEFFVLVISGVFIDDWAKGKFHWYPRNRKGLTMMNKANRTGPIFFLDSHKGISKHDVVRVKWERGLWHVRHFVSDGAKCHVAIITRDGVDRTVHHKAIKKMKAWL